MDTRPPRRWVGNPRIPDLRQGGSGIRGYPTYTKVRRESAGTRLTQRWVGNPWIPDPPQGESGIRGFQTDARGSADSRSAARCVGNLRIPVPRRDESGICGFPIDAKVGRGSPDSRSIPRSVGNPRTPDPRQGGSGIRGFSSYAVVRRESEDSRRLVVSDGTPQIPVCWSLATDRQTGIRGLPTDTGNRQPLSTPLLTPGTSLIGRSLTTVALVHSHWLFPDKTYSTLTTTVIVEGSRIPDGIPVVKSCKIHLCSS